uniref:Tensin-4-like n=1 Tax=Cyanistes caeruleus TaxID=156563 RepID=A0A8C0TZ93_CYACU
MSQVIESHVLRVGQTVCISSPEESESLRPPGYPGCSVLPAKYVYYSTEAWTDPHSMVRPKAPLLPSTRAYGAQPVSEHLPMSPSLDITIETLNQMILEIDPTFQPLPCRPVEDAAQPAQGGTAATEKPDPEAVDIKYIELTLGRATGPDQPRGTPSPSGTPFSRSPQANSFLPQKGVLGGKYSTSDSVVFSSPPGPSSPQSAALSCSTSMPWQCLAGHTDTVSHSPGALSTSPGADNLLKPLQVLRARQRGSWVSQLSTSPGSDTSYILGSSTHSLHNEDSDASATASPSPISSLGSPCSPSSAIVSHSREAFGQSPAQPRAGSSPSTSLGQKGQASSCPPSILTSAADIPVLLVNGCLEQGDGPPRLAKAPPSCGTQPPVPGCSPALRSFRFLLALTCLWSLAGPLKAGQPTMKFVMDTSKYWFKPSISRDRGSGLSLEFSGVPVGTQWGQIKAY